MIWVAWRQQRAQLITLLALLIVGGGVVVALGLSMMSYVDSQGLRACLTDGVDTGTSCTAGVNGFQEAWNYLLRDGQLFIMALPVLVGLFCGAPLFARELEQGTHVLAFTQSVSRIRWMASKFVVAALPALIVVLALQLLVEWWLSAAGAMGPLYAGPFRFITFDSVSTAPVAYTLFAFSLGMFAGAAFRRTLVGMIVTLVSFVVVRVVLYTVRNFLLPAQRVVSDDPAMRPIDWTSIVLRLGYLDAHGAQVSTHQAGLTGCFSAEGTPTAAGLSECYRQHGLAKWFADIIPPESAGALHLVDSGIYVGLAALLVLATGWAIRRQA